MPILQELITKGYITRPYLGVELYTVDRYVAYYNSLGVNKGAVVTTVQPGSPAAKAGMRKLDVITKYQGKGYNNCAGTTARTEEFKDRTGSDRYLREGQDHHDGHHATYPEPAAQISPRPCPAQETFFNPRTTSMPDILNFSECADASGAPLTSSNS